MRRRNQTASSCPDRTEELEQARAELEAVPVRYAGTRGAINVLTVECVEETLAAAERVAAILHIECTDPTRRANLCDTCVSVAMRRVHWMNTWTSETAHTAFEHVLFGCGDSWRQEQAWWRARLTPTEER